MINKKGQALVEFILILPILILFVLGIIDISRLIITENSLENTLGEVVDLYNLNQNETIIKTYLNSENDNIAYEINQNGEFTVIKLKENIDIVTPGLNLVLGTNRDVEVQRSIYNAK